MDLSAARRRPPNPGPSGFRPGPGPCRPGVAIREAWDSATDEDRKLLVSEFRKMEVGAKKEKEDSSDVGF